MNRSYEWWNIPDDPNRVGDEDYDPMPRRYKHERDEDVEYERWRDSDDD